MAAVPGRFAEASAMQERSVLLHSWEPARLQCNVQVCLVSNNKVFINRNMK